MSCADCERERFWADPGEDPQELRQCESCARRQALTWGLLGALAVIGCGALFWLI